MSEGLSFKDTRKAKSLLNSKAANQYETLEDITFKNKDAQRTAAKKKSIKFKKFS
jgi:hypothetical protein